jgi:hypothetical protein
VLQLIEDEIDGSFSTYGGYKNRFLGGKFEAIR